MVKDLMEKLNIISEQTRDSEKWKKYNALLEVKNAIHEMKNSLARFNG